MTTEFDARLRDSAMAWLAARTHDGLNPIASVDLLDFTFDGERLPLMDRQRGIRKPRQLSSALSIRTVYRPEGAARPYEDQQGPDGFLRYKWRGDDPDHAENRALRAAMKQEVPLIWFFGVGSALYQPIYPVYLLKEEPEDQQFVVAIANGHTLARSDSPMEAVTRRYVTAETKRRLHQPVFRATVMRAYETRCAVCALRHGELLDAAHIVADSKEQGVPAVTNGLAMCKIHHAAYDARILGIRPDGVVQIRTDLLDEVDGPMLRYGLVERHNQKLMALPAKASEQPDPALLEMTYAEFRVAG